MRIKKRFLSLPGIMLLAVLLAAGSVSALVVLGPATDMIFDDGSAEDSIGLQDPNLQFIWFNQFTPPAGELPIRIETVEMIFPDCGGTGADCNEPGDSVDLHFWSDTDSDPTTGAEFVATRRVSLDFADNTTFNTFTIEPPVVVTTTTGDILIGATSISPSAFPASIDQDFSQGRSWVGAYDDGAGGFAPVPAAPPIPSDALFGTIDSFGLAGNWMIRGYGSRVQISVPVCAWSNSVDGLNATFLDASTDADGTVDHWTWEFGDGGLSNQQNPIHTYAEPGTYSVTLTVLDDDNLPDTCTFDVVIGDPPMADFMAHVDGLEVMFEDLSNLPGGTIDGWMWDFADGNTSTEQSPTHTYTQGGLYNVSLEVLGSDGSTDTIVKSVYVSAKPTADFSTAVDFLTVAFTDTSTDDGTIDSWWWDFGDGTTSTEQNPSHTFEYQSSWTVSLMVTDNFGNTDMTTQQVGVTFPPAPDAGPFDQTDAMNPGGNGADGDCSCEVGHSPSTPWPAAAFLFGFGLLIMRRRRSDA